MSKEIKVFQLNESEWFAATTLDEAIKAYTKDLNYSVNDRDFQDEIYEPFELSKQQMVDNLLCTDDLDDQGVAEHNMISFREQLDNLIKSGETFPCSFATSEY